MGAFQALWIGYEMTAIEPTVSTRTEQDLQGCFRATAFSCSLSVKLKVVDY